MPEVSRFYGIIIALYYDDHAPPHFHAKYGGDQASILIETGELLDGSLSTRARRLIEEWRLLHESELKENWRLARTKHPLKKIEPLE